MRKSLKRTLVVGVAVVATAGAGVAYAAWTASGTGSGYAKAGSAQAVTTADASGSVTSLLYPGGTADVLVEIKNPNPFPVSVTAVSAGTGSIVASASGCTTTGVSFTAPGTLATAVTVPANGGDKVITLTGAAKMDNTSLDACQGASFTIPVSVTASSNAS